MELLFASTDYQPRVLTDTPENFDARKRNFAWIRVAADLVLILKNFVEGVEPSLPHFLVSGEFKGVTELNQGPEAAIEWGKKPSRLAWNAPTLLLLVIPQ